MRSEVVIARYSENLDWMGDIPGDFDVTIYNRGTEITSASALKRADSIVALANSGRESDTILRHILNKTEFGDGFTVFLQGDRRSVRAQPGHHRAAQSVAPMA